MDGETEFTTLKSSLTNLGPFQGLTYSFTYNFDSTMEFETCGPSNWYTSRLSSLSNEAPTMHLYTYNHVMDGFSVVLTKSQLLQLENASGFLTAFEETTGKLHTTHTPKFLGLKKHSGL
ncbi:proteinase inhibitor, propeptide, Peptidase S8, subtilisin-related protein [Artemisia annua]|uniref:Proteinase inhibitor, propeptide, Peptidase S8, subtilisin-related protein n=1 Tax=Artemisia annua TaxID=35608 RepID=A0A2U1NQM2_ARTAN|nr:proteinase inhibitor, propeptide, Peptidase S8, subtilisin-related protein [Artemisia annua]